MPTALDDAPHDHAVEKFRKDYTSLPYAIDSVDLDFDIVSEDKALVTSKLRFSLRPFAANGDLPPLVLDGEDLSLISIKVDGADFKEYELIKDGLTISKPPSTSFELETLVEINPKANTQLSGLYASSGNLCTQCEAEGFRRITYFYDRPDAMSSYRVRVEAHKESYPVLLSNGNEVESGLSGKDPSRHFKVFEDPHPKPSYLFALVAGDLGHIEDEFTTMNGRHVKLYVWSEHRNVKKLDWAMESLKRAMTWDEVTYGREYDLDVYHVVAVSDFNMGAMENKGLNVFNTACVLATPETATDGDFERVLGVVAHEYFHNWSGNRVTCRDWFQLTLKEGLTVFRDQTFSEDETSKAVKRIEDARIIRSAQFTQDSSPMKHSIRPESYVAMDNFYTVTVYNKGAEVIRMYRTLVGTDNFRKGMDLYFDRHDGQAVTCDDFRAAIADATGRDLQQFEEWYKQPGTPIVRVTSRGFDESNTKYSLTLSQSNDGQDKPLHIPIKAALVDATSGRVSDEAVFELTDKEQTFTFDNVKTTAVVPSLLRDFSAPVKLIFEPPLTVEELGALAGYDDDAFVKFDAWQQLAGNVVLEKYRGANGNGESLPSYLVDAFKATLNDNDAEPSLRAYSLALPDYSTLALAIDDGALDPSALCAALKATRKALAMVAEKELWACYETLTNGAPATFSIDNESVGQRRLRNACLSYLTKLDDTDGSSFDALLSHFDKATCMTDSLAAASLLAGLDAKKLDDTKVAERDARVQQFYEKAKANGDDLVVDKWFALQAAADVDGALEKVTQLLTHPDFAEVETPNRFRALVGTFAGANPNAFHAPDGAGYGFVADQVIKTDKKNPQLAARLCNVFGTWRRHEPGRRDLMKLALERIRDADGLSKDTFEIADRTLTK